MITLSLVLLAMGHGLLEMPDHNVCDVPFEAQAARPNHDFILPSYEPAEQPAGVFQTNQPIPVYYMYYPVTTSVPVYRVFRGYSVPCTTGDCR